MKQEGKTYKDLSSELCCNSYDVTNVITKGRFNSKRFPEIADALGKPMEYFILGRVNETPVVPWGRIDNWELIKAEVCGNNIPVHVSSTAKALRIEDDSMLSTQPLELSFKCGQYIIVEPIYNDTLKEGDYAVVVLCDGSTVFRKLIHGGKLIALNPYHPHAQGIDLSTVKIKGVAVSIYVDLKINQSVRVF